MKCAWVIEGVGGLSYIFGLFFYFLIYKRTLFFKFFIRAAVLCAITIIPIRTPPISVSLYYKLVCVCVREYNIINLDF